MGNVQSPTSPADKEARNAFARAVPKAELHIHVEGTLMPEMAFKLAARNGLPPPAESPAALQAKYAFGDLQSFLDLYHAGCNVLITEADFTDLAWAYFLASAEDGLKHAELFFDPQTHTIRGVDMGVVVRGLKAAMVRAETELGITSKLIMCFCRNFGPGMAEETFAAAMPYLEHIVGIGMDSTEIGYPPAPFGPVYAKARAAGLRCCSHGGEEGPPDPFLTDALDILKCDRLDHGIRCMEDKNLVARLARERIALTVCPVSNVKLRCVKTLQEHPLPAMLRAGILVSINSDDPAYFGGFIGDVYVACAEAWGMSVGQIAVLAKNSFESSFLDADAKAAYCAQVDAALTQFIGSEAAAVAAIAEAAILMRARAESLEAEAVTATAVA